MANVSIIVACVERGEEEEVVKGEGGGEEEEVVKGEGGGEEEEVKGE